ncbi:MAG: hydroxyacid dehydrogenase [Nitrososphaerales archaeon]
MDAFRVLVCDPISESGIDRLKKGGLDVSYEPEISSAELINRIPDYEVIVVRSRTKVTEQVISAGTKLRVIGRAGTGVDNISINEANKAGIKVVNTPEASVEAVAELALGLMLSFARKITIATSTMKSGKWLKWELMGSQLKDKNIGVVGLGRIGTRVSELCLAFGMKILAYDPYLSEEKKQTAKRMGIEMVDMDNLLLNSDFVTLHIPLTPETRHLVNEHSFAKMKGSACLINTSRGETVDEKALLSALLSGNIFGAALDVFEVEPPTTRELVEHPSVICTPHVGSQTKEVHETAALMLVDKISEALSTSS